MFSLCTYFVVASMIFATANLAATPPPTESSLRPVYKPETASSEYIPHVTYPFADSYGQSQPYDVGYGYGSYPLYPTRAPTYEATLIPSVQSLYEIAIRTLTKIGFLVLGASAILILGGLFTTIVCSLTPFCTIKFAGFGPLDKDLMRSMMTPEKIETAAALVEDAIGKYQNMQKAV